MPTYEYVCEKCEHEFEKFQSMLDKPLKVCPADLCAQKRWGKGKVKKQVSAGAGLIFKGTGFYITDYRSDKYKEAAKKDTAPAASTADAKTPASTGGDNKPAASTSGDTKPAATAAADSKPAKKKD